MPIEEGPTLISYPVVCPVAGLADGAVCWSEDGALGWLGDDSDRMGTDTCRSIESAFVNMNNSSTDQIPQDACQPLARSVL